MGFLMPKIQPLPIKTLNQKWYKKFWIWATHRREWELLEDYRLFGKFIPRGFVYDGASVPRIFWSLLSPTGILFIPSIFHDFGYVYGGYVFESLQDGYVFEKKSKAHIDDEFLRMCEAVNGMSFLDRAAWLAVKTAVFSWRKRRKNNQKVSEDFPWLMKK